MASVEPLGAASPLRDRAAFGVRAIALGMRIELRGIDPARALAVNPLTVAAGQQGCAVLFRYGVAVLFNLSEEEQAAFVDGLRGLVALPHERRETEDAAVTIDPAAAEGVAPAGIVLNRADVEHLQLVAEVLARSVLLSYYEQQVQSAFDRVDPLAARLQQGGSGGSRGRELLRHIGDGLATEARMVGRAEITDKPELLWDRVDLDRLYGRLEDEYELRERHAALERKLDLVSRTAQTLLELLQHRRSLRVEWYIVILILVEIVLTLYELFFRH